MAQLHYTVHAHVPKEEKVYEDTTHHYSQTLHNTGACYIYNATQVEVADLQCVLGSSYVHHACIIRSTLLSILCNLVLVEASCRPQQLRPD
jgi:hypothetical protein